MKKSRDRQSKQWQENLMLSSQSHRIGYRINEVYGVSLSERIRVRLLSLVMLVVAVGLSSRLIYLSGFERGRYRLTSETNNLEQVRDVAPRGLIVDRYGEVLVKNVQGDDGSWQREYVLGASGAHLLGYLAEVTKDEIGCRYGWCYRAGDLIGRVGVEKEFENVLKGKDGGKLIEVDAQGKVVRELGVNQAEMGQTVKLSIDKELQLKVAKAMKERKGAVVILDMQGKVLALYSSPAYDPNVFSSDERKEERQKLLADTKHSYFLNRAIGGVYASGSVFKLVTAYAGLEEGVIDRDSLIEDTGVIKIDNYRFGNWYYDEYGKTEGQINVERALGRSNDIFFYRVGEKVGVDKLVKWAHKFGLGEKTGIELSGEREGLVPDRLWKERTKGERWFLGNTYHLAIGQGDLLTTPLQVARMTLGAVSGRLCRVSILVDSEVECKDLGLKTENIEIVREGMRQACTDGGTAFPLFKLEPYTICKTGTAQHAGQKTDKDLPHAWITVAYPGENPEMIITVMLDSAGEGSREAGPVVKEILEGWKE